MQGWLRGLLLMGCLLPGLVSAQEAIEDFAVSLQVEADGNLLVIEQITVRAEGRDIRRGIYRDLPVSYALPMGLEQRSPITLLGVTRDGQPESVRSERSGAWVRFYLGSPDVLLETGRHRYELRYRVGRILLHHADTDELYWNVTGNGWVFPIRQASVEVLLPSGARIGQLAAYTGAQGDQGQDFQILERRDDYLRLATNAELPAYHGLTVAVDWQAGLVPRPGAMHNATRALLDNLGVGIGAALLIGLLLFYLRAWSRVGRDPRKGVIIPLFEGPQGMSAVQAGYLWHRGLRGAFPATRAFSVWLTDMAIRKHLHIEDKTRGGGFSLARDQGAGGEMSKLDRDLRKRLFLANKEGVALTIGTKYEPRLADAVAGLSSRLGEQGKAWFANNRGIWALGVLWAVLGCALMLVMSTHGDDFAIGLAGLVFGLGFGVPALIMFNLAWRQPSFGKKLPLILAALMFGWPMPVGLLMIADVAPLPTLLLVILYAVLVTVFYYLMPAPSLEGRRLLDALEGYRDYLQLAERDVLALAGDAPAMSIALYERHLPFAMALGVEDKWSARFSEALASGLIDPAQRDYQPSWYHSRNSYSSPQALSGALAAGLASATALASSPPSSSSSGGGGSSGGGSSGGGGGGGGGGGW
ncbi:DUF2207 domain-containing protein [Ectopseudomonas alcaliphila]|uniref:DUF2207 domain-containing protein n=1 Tax=Ectopseudomonas alcaliphila TaxID=101564 RepID=A0A1G7B301_9GAMM|nr:DUF2207 domain-containing protein [Pseudomonas alcaliphila]MDX5993269.1 DUF2207 domain-containing protein [Pseudomonas alcaliphila]SDE21469.1 Predicted membrane protein [Pseudomonas alcaliphila]